MSQVWTVRCATERIVELGLTSPDMVAKTLQAEWLDMPLAKFGGGATDAKALTGLLVDLSVGFDVHTDDMEHLDTMAFAENIDEFTNPAASPRRWAMPTVDGELIHYRHIFADPVALRQLGEEFGIEFDVDPE